MRAAALPSVRDNAFRISHGWQSRGTDGNSRKALMTRTSSRLVFTNLRRYQCDELGGENGLCQSDAGARDSCRTPSLARRVSVGEDGSQERGC